MNSETKKIFSEVEKIISPVYMVGGSVRDEILGNPPHDYDFTTPLSPLAMEEKIRAAGKRPYCIGNRFGTVGMKIDGTLVEITTYRTETYVSGSRKPAVEFVSSLEEDLKRRDFTINSLAMDSSGEIMDYFGGREDLEKGIIRCVGDPAKRFKEDPLRMLRAARFCSQLGFDIDIETIDAARNLSYKILEVSKERWCIEMDRILLTDNPRNALVFLWYTRLFNYMIPELSLQYNYNQGNPHHNHALHEHTIRVVEETIPDTILRWAALLHDIGKPFVRQEKETPTRSVYYRHDLLGAEITEKTARYLRWSNARTDLVVELVDEHMSENSPLYDADTKAK